MTHRFREQARSHIWICVHLLLSRKFPTRLWGCPWETRFLVFVHRSPTVFFTLADSISTENLRLKDFNVLSLRPFRPLSDVEFHFFTFLKRLEPFTDDGRKVNEHVRPAPILSNETKPLLRVKPLHCACCHCRSPWIGFHDPHGSLDNLDMRREDALGPMDPRKLHPQALFQPNPARTLEIHVHRLIAAIQCNQAFPGSPAIGFDRARYRFHYRSLCIFTTTCVQCAAMEPRAGGAGYCQS